MKTRSPNELRRDGIARSLYLATSGFTVLRTLSISLKNSQAINCIARDLLRGRRSRLLRPPFGYDYDVLICLPLCGAATQAGAAASPPFSMNYQWWSVVRSVLRANRCAREATVGAAFINGNS